VEVQGNYWFPGALEEMTAGETRIFDVREIIIMSFSCRVIRQNGVIIGQIYSNGVNQGWMRVRLPHRERMTVNAILPTFFYIIEGVAL